MLDGMNNFAQDLRKETCKYNGEMASMNQLRYQSLKTQEPMMWKLIEVLILSISNTIC